MRRGSVRFMCQLVVLFRIVENLLLNKNNESFSYRAVDSGSGDRYGYAGGMGEEERRAGPSGILGSDQLNPLPGGSRVLPYPVTSDIPEFIESLWV